MDEQCEDDGQDTPVGPFVFLTTPYWYLDTSGRYRYVHPLIGDMTPIQRFPVEAPEHDE